MKDLQPDTKWLIVGLGNPGQQYERTRHNFGFLLIEKLAVRLQTQVRRDECRALIGRGEIENQVVELVKPQTFMNVSGEAVSCLIRKTDRDIRRLIVVSDDVALPFGRMRIRTKGSHGGQNGLRSIIDCLRTQEFIRIRLGIMPEFPVTNMSGFVLDNFSRSEQPELDGILDTAADAVCDIVTSGVDKAMAKHN